MATDPSDPRLVRQGLIAAVMTPAIEPLMHELVGERLDVEPSPKDQQAIHSAVEMAFVLGARAARSRPDIADWDRPWGDQWEKKLGRRRAAMTTAKRSYGSGSLFIRADSTGAESWYGKFYVDGRQVKRKLGPKRAEGSRDGLTRAQAESELRKVIERQQAQPTVTARVTVADAAERMLQAREARGLRPSTLSTYRSLITTHVLPRVGEKPLSKVTVADLEAMVREMRRDGAGPKLVLNVLGVLHGVFKYGMSPDRGWCADNPCARVEKPKVERNEDIQYLTLPEVEALLRAVPADTVYGASDRVMFLTAAMTGLRQGEQLALRWSDVDWTASTIRVRRNYVRGEWGTPKSRRSSRAVPMADRVARELDLHFQRSRYQADDDLVFGHPEIGEVQDHSALVRRFKAALRAAEVRQVRYHDLRHTFGTQMAAAGVAMRTLQEWLGHRDPQTTAIYADYLPRPTDAALVQQAFAAASPDLLGEVELSTSLVP